MKKNIFIITFLINYIFVCSISFSIAQDNKNIIKERKEEQKLSIRKFLNTYIFPEKNQVFLDKASAVGIFVGYHYDKIIDFSYKGYVYGYENCRRNLGSISVSYSRPTNFANFNGRISIGLFTLIGNDIGKYRDKGDISNFRYDYRMLGVEIIQEQLFGTDKFYITLGAGISYMFFNKHKFAYPLPHNSLANFVLTASAGHRFNNGVILEIAWKHYSNGELRPPNRGINAFGLAVRYAFD